MRRALLAAAVLALPLAGCGAAPPSSKSKFQGEQQKVAQVVDDLSAAGSSGDAEKICSDILSKSLVAELKSAGGDCVSEMKAAIDDASDYDLRVSTIKVAGNTATAQVRQGSKGPLATFSFVKENGAWRASELGS
jgi:hypothetical protein